MKLLQNLIFLLGECERSGALNVNKQNGGWFIPFCVGSEFENQLVFVLTE